ncbi:hypothetical protein ANCCAN_11195 [Ancylostoma caninum]|uniref:Uncharacterized protein n=1 Tax=Ancylostoma caninum TaxID=29170 RepID=A0A368GIX8_ANCCA|nr:hypothetical protein ANCCAN_11195 [Ancylostoma caninum]
MNYVHKYRRIEEFIDDDADVVFYDRFHPTELMPGSYLFHLAETVTPDRQVEIAVCRRVWSKCHSWRDVFVALSCMRNIIGETVYYGKVKILAKVPEFC